jgi:putative ABC transport system permease protein
VISAGRLAWLQLRRQKIRFAVAIAGVSFAVVLMFMQLGFQDALFRSAVNVHQRLKGDLFFLHPNYNVIAFPIHFPRVRLYQALGFPGVASVTPVYTSPAQWKNTVTGRTRDLLLIGVDPESDVLDVEGFQTKRELLRDPDVLLYDEHSRPEYGPIAATVAAGDTVASELDRRQVTVRGLFRMGASFGVDATMITSDLNFVRIKRMPFSWVSIGVVQVEPNADVKAVQAALRRHLPRDVKILTRAEMIAAEIGYWASATPIGFVFAFGVVMGLVVGMIIVYQILFADIADHLKEYATLKAMGYANRYLVGVVLMQATILGIVGFFPGLAICERLYAVTQRATMLAMVIEPVRAGQVLLLTIVMCCASALIAVRKLRAADPADVF